MRSKIHGKLFLLLLVCSVFGALAVLPFAITMQGGKDAILQRLPAEVAAQLPSLPVLIFVQTLQMVVVLSVCIFLGLLLSKKVGLKIPFLSAWLAKESFPYSVKLVLQQSVLWGVLVGAAIIAVDAIFSQWLSLPVSGHPPMWQALLASFYGGITEEVLLRLFLMTLLVWIGTKIGKKKQIIISDYHFFGAIILTAIFFGIGHLPAMQLLTELTPLVIIRTIFLNAIGGVIFGWLYWKKGLESAIIAHFSADIVLHALFPLFF